MNFPMFLNKWIIGLKPIKYTPFWWWYRLISHQGFRFDDYHVWGEFWHSLNHGWEHMEYVHKFEEFWGKGSYPPEKIILPKKSFDALVEKLNEPPQYNEKIARVLSKKPPWNEE
jgi:hypothetical protein